MIASFTVAEKDRVKRLGYCGAIFDGEVVENGKVVPAVFQEVAAIWKHGALFLRYERVR